MKNTRIDIKEVVNKIDILIEMYQNKRRELFFEIYRNDVVAGKYDMTHDIISDLRKLKEELK